MSFLHILVQMNKNSVGKIVILFLECGLTQYAELMVTFEWSITEFATDQNKWFVFLFSIRCKIAFNIPVRKSPSYERKAHFNFLYFFRLLPNQAFIIYLYSQFRRKKIEIQFWIKSKRISVSKQKTLVLQLLSFRFEFYAKRLTKQ